MDKKFKIYFPIWAILFAVFNIISFIIPSAKIGSFWVGYAFINIIIVAQLLCSYLFFNEKTDDGKFLNLPIITVSYISLTVSVVIGSVFMAVPSLPIWITVAVSLLITAFYVISVISIDPVAQHIENTDRDVKINTYFIKSLTADAETLIQTAKEKEIKTTAEKIYEALKYSDPMSNAVLSDCENSITEKFKEFEQAVKCSNCETVEKTAKELLILIDNRNKKCKLLK